MVFVFLYLNYFTLYYNLCPSMLRLMALFHSFLWLSSIPLYICTTYPLSIHLFTGDRLFPYLDYCEQCHYEHRSACIFWNYRFVWIYAQESGYWIIKQHYFYLLEKCLSIVFSIVAAPIYIPINHVGVFLFLLSTFCMSSPEFFYINPVKHTPIIAILQLKETQALGKEVTF